jgi:hypothetical protein
MSQPNVEGVQGKNRDGIKESAKNSVQNSNGQYFTSSPTSRFPKKAKKETKSYERTPFGYDGQNVTSHKLHDLLATMMHRLGPLYAFQPAVVLEMWPQIVGEKLASFTSATRYEDGFLYVKVKNSTLLSLLSNPVDKQKIQEAVKAAVPGIVLKNIVFRIG